MALVEFEVSSLLDCSSVGTPADAVNVVNIDVLDIVLKLKEEGLTLKGKVSCVESNVLKFLFASAILDSVIEINIIETVPES